jgi:hypothetical protein
MRGLRNEFDKRKKQLPTTPRILTRGWKISPGTPATSQVRMHSDGTRAISARTMRSGRHRLPQWLLGTRFSRQPAATSRAHHQPQRATEAEAAAVAKAARSPRRTKLASATSNAQ